jgi:hypothetical protein
MGGLIMNRPAFTPFGSVPFGSAQGATFLHKNSSLSEVEGNGIHLPYFKLIAIDYLLILLLCFLSFSLQAETNKNIEPKAKSSSTTTSWWEKRHQQTEFYFPHNAHLKIMQKRGDLCMACHPFTGTPKTTLKQQRQLTQLANEPLKAICHQCHLLERSAPLDCKICHKNINKIRPKDHGQNFIDFHGAEAKQNEAQCRSCHLEMSFCTNCHFQHNNNQHIKHPLGYRNQHGLDARLDATACGKCHNTHYCRDCHRGRH